MRPLVALIFLAFAWPVSAFTIDFEDFELGPLPATYPTPWGDLEFRSGNVRDNPLGPGTKMAYGFAVPDAEFEGEVGSLFLMFPTDQVFEASFLLVNLNPEPRSLEGWDVDDDGGELNDFGIGLPAEGNSTVTFTFGNGLPGVYFLGVVADMTETDRCIGENTTCNGMWGLDSLTFQPIPEPSTAILLAIGFVGIATRRFRRARPARGYGGAAMAAHPFELSGKVP